MPCGESYHNGGLPSVDFVKTPEKFFSLLTDSNLVVKSVDILTDEVLKVVHEPKDETPSYHNNVIVAAFTTCHACLILYSYLEKLGDRVLYGDTDSVLYKGKPVIPYLHILGG